MTASGFNTINENALVATSLETLIEAARGKGWGGAHSKFGTPRKSCPSPKTISVHRNDLVY